MRKGVLSLALLALCLFVGCDADITGGPAIINITGTWDGTASFNSPPGARLTLVATLQQSGTRLTGEIGGPGQPAGQLLTGSVNGHDIVFSVTQPGGCIVNGRATVDQSETRMTGFYAAAPVEGLSCNLFEASIVAVRR